MKTQIRSGVFETNSSSMHAMAIKNNVPEDIFTSHKGEHLLISGGEFGWQETIYNDPTTIANYVYTALVHDYMATSNKDVSKIKDNLAFLTRVLNKFGVEVSYVYPYPVIGDYTIEMHAEDNINSEYFDGYIDHEGGQASDFLSMTDEELFTFIFSGTLITSNDNGGSEYFFATQDELEKEDYYVHRF